ncbi:MAG: LysM peptidoglycan-binding domain-containing protein [Bacillota bacterium]
MIVYTVRRGDTLWDICQRFGGAFEATVRLNDLAHPDHIYPGLELTVETSDTAGKTFCVVQSGETLWDIAQRHRVSMEALVAQNGLRHPDEIYPGRLILIAEAPRPDKPGVSHEAGREQQQDDGETRGAETPGEPGEQAEAEAEAE